MEPYLMNNESNYGTTWWQRTRGCIVKWWSYVYTPVYRVLVPVGDEVLTPEEDTTMDMSGVQIPTEETEEERQLRLHDKALAELQAISDEDWKNREEDEQRKAAEILARLHAEAEELERRKQAEVQRLREETEAQERLRLQEQSQPEQSQQELDDLQRAQEIFERLQREAEEDERVKQAEIEAAKAAAAAAE